MLEIPGYAEALAWEERTREEAYLGVCAPLCGVPVRPLSLRRLSFLLQARSAFFFRDAFGAEDVTQFLWIVSEAFRPGDLDATARFIAELSIETALDDLPSAYGQIRDYLDKAFNDAPASSVRAGSLGYVPLASFQSSLIDAICSQYTGWSLNDVLDAPLAVLHQQLCRIGVRLNPAAVFLSRRSLKVRGDWLRSIQPTVQHLQADPPQP